MPTLFVGLHLAIAIVLALFGLSLFLDPCGGGGDLCLGGVAGLTLFGAAGLGGIGMVIWQAVKRASPLLVWDSVILVPATYLLFQMSGYGPVLASLGILLVLVAVVPGVVMAGRAVATHRVERLLAVAALIGIAVLAGRGGIEVLVTGAIALGVGWLLARNGPRQGADAAPQTPAT